jgi:hypothetical protein
MRASEPMTVGELRAKLRLLDGDAIVVIDGLDGYGMQCFSHRTSLAHAARVGTLRPMSKRSEWIKGVVERYAHFKAMSECARTEVYFIQAGDGGPIKIGISDNVPLRLNTLQTAHHETLRLLSRIPGGESDEAALHEQFAALRIRGEWFRPGAELLAHIARLEGR